MSEQLEPLLLTREAQDYLASLDTLASCDPDDDPAGWEPGGAIFEALADLAYARGERLRPAAEGVLAAGLGPWLEALAARDPAGFACLAHWEDDPEAIPPAVASVLGDLAVCRSQAWSRVRDAWARQDSQDAADHAAVTGVGIRPGTWPSIRSLLGVGERGESPGCPPVISGVRISADAGDDLEIPSFLLRRGGR